MEGRIGVIRMGVNASIPESSLLPSYKSFLESTPYRRVNVSINKPVTWNYFCEGEENAPTLVCIPSTMESAGVFFQQVQTLSQQGIRVIATEIPDCSSFSSMCHILGSGLGGFIALHYTKRHQSRVKSLILVNSFCSNRKFRRFEEDKILAPASSLKTLILEDISEPEPGQDNESARRLVMYLLQNASREILGARYALKGRWKKLAHPVIEAEKISIILPNDCSKQVFRSSEYIAKSYPNAYLFQTKTGGLFPYLSQPVDINMYIIVHLRRYESSLRPSIGIEPGQQLDIVFSHESPADRTDRAEQIVSSEIQEKPPEDQVDDEKDDLTESEGSDWEQ